MKLFLPQKTLEDWIGTDKADLEDGKLVVREPQSSHPVTAAVHFVKVVSGSDANQLTGRVKKAGVRKWIRFNAPVRMVEWDKKKKKFNVTAHDRVKDRMYTEEFDYAVVSSGHYSTPHVPEFDGIRSFNGRVMHAHDFRDALEFKGKHVLIVGRSYSAEDIGSQCWKYGAASVTCTYRSKPMGFKWPERFAERPLLQRLDGNTATFKDGSTKDIDAIILCTGYQHHFPFLSEELRLKTANRLWPLNLYKGIVWEDNTRLLYLGMQDQFYTFNMFDAQAWYARDVIMGRIKPPKLDVMRKHSKAWRKREEKLADAEQMIWFQGDYVKDLLAATDYPSFDVEAVNKTFMQWEHHKMDDIMGFRNNAYRSLMTGTMSPKHHTPWLEEMDDSMEAYLKTV